jgi:hypothetical protein
MEWLQALSLAVAWGAGKLATSPLKGENDDARVSGRTNAWLLPLLLTGSLAVSGCLPKSVTLPAPVDPAPTEQQVQDIRNQAEKLAIAVREASALAVQAGRLADQAYAAGLIPPATMQRINDAGIAAATHGETFVEFARTVTTDPSLRATSKALMTVFDDYLTALASGGQSGDAIRTALAALRAYLGVQ